MFFKINLRKRRKIFKITFLKKLKEGDGMNKKRIVSIKDAQMIVENFLVEKKGVFGEHVIGVPIEKKKEYVIPLCNGRNGLLDFWATVFKSDRHLLIRKA